jgi:hydrogenase maturation factor
VHAGVAIAKLDEASALETLRILASIDFDDDVPVDSAEGAAQ